ncbi:adult-specific cuticular protein ACP-20-like [Musca vetustissima]|uniref:adult-specific cuticular protein ACP-20-like n=1 Tax=Musca vetustissima TaxID=27455 RepID=UPI002AB61BB3|nr:adult-specific cuticular protein ACP-20-like [Musca vetustissima]
MRSIISLITILVVGVCLIEAKPHKYHGDDGGHGKATSYAIVTKHETEHGSGGHGGHGDSGSHGYDDHSEYHGYSQHGGHGGDHEEYYGKGHHGGDDDGHDYHSHPKYDFEYGVKDSKTGDVKEQWESRDGDKVKGSYSLKEADGTTRVVNYSSDKKSGFEATVHKIGHAHHDYKEESHHGHGYHGKHY